MDFKKRKSIAVEKLCDFFGAYSTPRGLDHDQQAARISAIAEAFARRIPTKGDYHEAIDRVFNSIRDTHLSNSWPTQAAFVMAMPSSERMAPKAAESFSPDLLELTAEKIRGGEAIQCSAVWGRLAGQLVNSGLVSHEQIEAYRRGSVAWSVSVYRESAEEWMVARYGEQVRSYFLSKSQIAAM